MTTETINGLHKCQPKNEPQAGQVKTFQVIHNPAKNGKKAWIKIKSTSEDKGGTPYRIVSVEPTGWEPDDYGNVSFNLEIEPTLGGATGEKTHNPVQAASVAPSQNFNGVEETRRHIMQSANLYVLCINAVNSFVASHLPEVAQTSEQFQAAVGTLFIEASSRRTNDGVNWWSYVDKMPTKPVSND